MFDAQGNYPPGFTGTPYDHDQPEPDDVRVSLDEFEHAGALITIYDAYVVIDSRGAVDRYETAKRAPMDIAPELDALVKVWFTTAAGQRAIQSAIDDAMEAYEPDDGSDAAYDEMRDREGT
jgi:hypothetical protein